MSNIKKKKQSKKMDRRQFIIEIAKGGGYVALGIALTDVVSSISLPRVGKIDPTSLPGGAGDFEGV